MSSPGHAHLQHRPASHTWPHPRALLPIVLSGMLLCACGNAVEGAGTAMAAVPATMTTLPPATQDLPLARTSGTATAVFAGGCFWGVEGVFEHLKGVTHVESGYSGGSAGNADYPSVSSGKTRHAEAVRITWDPSQISYGTLLRVFFAVAHDPTQLNRQGPDVGPQYRSGVFVLDAPQERITRAYIAQLDAAGLYRRPIVTIVAPFKAFYPAEAEHQDYMRKNPRAPYVVYHDAPKLVALQRQFPALYRTWTEPAPPPATGSLQAR